MPALERSQSSDCATPELDLFTRANGALVNVSILEYQIFEKVTTPGVPIQTFPPSGRATVDLTDCPTGDKLGTGHYVALYDVPALQIIGTHQIKWFFKLTPADPEQFFNEEFEVLEVGGILNQFYISVSDVRDAGLTDIVAFPDARVQKEIATWQPFIDRATRQWFNERDLEMYFDGTDSDAIHFGVPIISIETLRINSNTTALEAAKYKVYNSERLKDDKHNPRIKLITGDNTDIFTGPLSRGSLIFRKGRQNQYVKGRFGYLEDGGTPAMIQRALTKLVIEKLTNPIYVAAGISPPEPPPILAGLIKEEWTDGHKVKYGAAAGGDRLPRRASPLSGFTNDSEILDILKMYRAPIGIATPANPTTFR